jgi:hypothetical protein
MSKMLKIDGLIAKIIINQVERKRPHFAHPPYSPSSKLLSSN